MPIGLGLSRGGHARDRDYPGDNTRGLRAAIGTGAASAQSAGKNYSVQVAQAMLANVRDVVVSGADIALIEVRQGTGGGLTLAPGRIGRIDLVITTDWDAAEQTMETWRATIIAGTGQPTQIRRTVTIAIMGRPAGPLLARYAFQRCLPTEHRMHFRAQHEPISEVWRISCESVQHL